MSPVVVAVHPADVIPEYAAERIAGSTVPAYACESEAATGTREFATVFAVLYVQVFYYLTYCW